MITLNDVTMEWEGKKVLSDINLSVGPYDFIAITGPNGGGKTTLLRIMLKLLSPTSGTVTYRDSGGAEVKRLPIGYLPQKNSIDSKFPLTVSDVISTGLLGTDGLSKVEKKERVEEIIDLVQLRTHASHTIGELSGGQLQRALLGRALISRPRVLVLDEPLSYLDKHFEHETYRLLENLAPTTSIVLVSHEMSTIAEMATRHLIVNHTIHECSSAHHHFITTCDQ